MTTDTTADTPPVVPPAFSAPATDAEPTESTEPTPADKAAMLTTETNDEKLAKARTQIEQLTAERDRLATAFAERQHAEDLATWRKEVSKETRVPVQALELLAGDTLEDITANAEALKAAIPQLTRPPAFVQHMGNPNMTGVPATLDEQIQAALSAGDQQLVRSLKAMQIGQAALGYGPAI